ncbi:hypothetical protein ABTI03_19390, partial [Acinetobacter baumannii]
MCDVGGFLPPRTVWAAISDLAEALLMEALDAVWKENAPRLGLPAEPFLGVV